MTWLCLIPQISVKWLFGFEPRHPHSVIIKVLPMLLLSLFVRITELSHLAALRELLDCFPHFLSRYSWSSGFLLTVFSRLGLLGPLVA